MVTSLKAGSKPNLIELDPAQVVCLTPSYVVVNDEDTGLVLLFDRKQVSRESISLNTVDTSFLESL